MQANATALPDTTVATSACSICGTSNRDNAEFCRCCGVSITRSNPLTEIEECGTAFCGRCRCAHSLPARFCDRCGGKLDRPLRAASNRIPTTAFPTPDQTAAQRGPDRKTLDGAGTLEARRVQGSAEEATDLTIERAAKAAVSHIFQGAPATVTVVSEKTVPVPENANPTAKDKEKEKDSDIPASRQSGVRSSNARRFPRVMPALLVIGAAGLTGLAVHLTEQEKAWPVPAMAQEPAPHSIAEADGAAQAAAVAKTPLFTHSLPPHPVQDHPEQLAPVADETAEPGARWTDFVRQSDNVRKNVSKSLQTQDDRASLATSATPRKPVSVSTAQRELNYEPESEIRVRPPLPLVEFKSVIRIDPPAN